MMTCVRLLWMAPNVKSATFKKKLPIKIPKFNTNHKKFISGNPNSPENYVVKVEPHHNGPLFVELNFYCRAASTEEIQEFACTKNLSHIGIPDLKGSGSFIFRNRRLRFIVIPKYGKDLQTVLEELPNQTLSVQSASYIAFQMVRIY